MMSPRRKLPPGWTEAVPHPLIPTPEAYTRRDGVVSLTVSFTQGPAGHMTTWYVCDQDKDEACFMGGLGPGNCTEAAFFMANNWSNHDRIHEAGKSLIPQLGLDGLPEGWTVSLPENKEPDPSEAETVTFHRKLADVRIEMTRIVDGPHESYIWLIYSADGGEKITFGFIGKGSFRNLAMGLAENWDKTEHIRAAFRLPDWSSAGKGLGLNGRRNGHSIVT